MYNILKRWLDVTISASMLIVAAPVLFLAAVAIKRSSPGPVFFQAQRAGLNGVPFRMLKLRTMHIRDTKDSPITAADDLRIFPFGNLLRRLKIDELPQLWNVLKGEMSLVGPRPEDLHVVVQHFNDWMRETLLVRPGLTSPGALFAYVYGRAYMDDSDPEGSYVSSLMPVKLAVERVYIEQRSLLYDFHIVWRTIVTVGKSGLGLSPLPQVPELEGVSRYWDGELITNQPERPIY